MLAKAIPKFRILFPYDKFIEQLVAGMSRSFRLNDLDIKQELSGLVPIADSINHSLQNHSIWEYKVTGIKGRGFYIHSVGETKKGEQFFITYGNKPAD